MKYRINMYIARLIIEHPRETYGFSFTVWIKKSAKKIRKQVRGCLQNLYQSIAIHLKDVLLVLL